MDNVVVKIDGQIQKKKNSPNRNGSPSHSNGCQDHGDAERIADIVGPKSPSPKRTNLPNTRSRGSSYNFAEDEQPLAAAVSIPEEEQGVQALEGDGNRRNKSFDFGVSLNGNGNNGTDIPSSSPRKRGTGGSSAGYYRLPSPPKDQSHVVVLVEDQQDAKNTKPVSGSPEISMEAGNRKPKTSLKVAIAADSEISDDGKANKKASESSTQNVSFRKSPGNTSSSFGSSAMKTLPPDAIVVKAPTNFNRLKSKSRLAEPAPPVKEPLGPGESPGKLAANAPTVPSARMGQAQVPTDEEEDPLRDVDLPHKYRHQKWGLCFFFQLASLLSLMALMVCSIIFNRLKKHTFWSLQLWKWALMALVVLSGRLLSGWLIHSVVFFIERNFMWRKRVLYFVYGLRKGVQTALWLTLVLVAWLLLFDRKVERSTKSHKALTYITKVLICCLLAAFIWLAKRSRSSANISWKGSRDRHEQNPKKDKEKSQQDPVLSIDKLQQMNQKNVSAWNMKRLIMLVKQSKISTLSQAIDSSNAFQEGQENEIQTEWQARAAAKEVFRNVAKNGYKYIELEDLLRFLSEKEAQKAFNLFEGATDAGRITKKNLVNWVTNVYRERRSLALSLNDTKTAVDKLHHIINAVTAIVIIIISLLVLGLATSHFLVVVSSQLLLIVFIFGNTCKTVFEAIIFLFVMHPYDVGDRCVIDGVQMTVEEMNILTTVFLRYDNEKIYYPNSVLANKPISNWYRSPDMTDAIDFTVDMSTPMEKIAALKDKIAKYISSRSAHWHNKSTIVVKEIEDMNRMKMALWVQHTMNFQNNGERLIRRSELVIKLKSFCQELGIEYHLLPQEVILTEGSAAARTPPLPP